MSLMQVQGLTKSHGLKRLFADLSFAVEDGDRIGVIGVNGSGKSTLLKMLAALEPADSGLRTLRQGVRVEYLPQAPEFPEGATVLDYVFSTTSGSRAAREAATLTRDYEICAAQLATAPEESDEHATLLQRLESLAGRMDAAGAWEFEARARVVLGRLGVSDFEASLMTLSGGYRKRVALAHALLAEADLLLLDEPTNHLDADTIAWLENQLARYSGAVVLVTHDRYFLDRVARRLFELEAGRLREYAGNFARYLEQKGEDMERAASTEERRRNILRGELAWLKRGARARTTKQKARVDRIETLRETKGPATRAELEFATQTRRLGGKIVELHNVSKALGGRTLLKDFSHVFTRGERLGVIGPNGCGKTTLARLLINRLTPDSGRVEVGETVLFGLYEQESRDMDPTQRAIEHVRLEGGENLRAPDGAVLAASLVMERFLFTPQMQHQPIGKLSGGERRRLNLVTTLMRDPNFLILDEPTNDLDIVTLEALEDFLEGFSGCVMVVSHDRYFLDRTVDQLLAFEGNGATRLYPGNYSAYAAIREEEQAARAQAEKSGVSTGKSPTPVAAPASVAPAVKQKLSYKEKRELETLENSIPATEARLAAINEELAAAAADYTRLHALTAEQAQLIAQLETATARWEELAARAE